MSKLIPRFAAGLVVVFALAGAGLGASLVAPGVAGAVTTFTVNDAHDLALSGTTMCTSTNETCTLRAAIEAATNVDADTTINLPDPTTLGAGLAASAYVLSLGQLDVADAGGTVTIVGAGSGLVTIEAAASPGTATTRVLEVDPNAAANITGVTIANGDPGPANGGGILASGPLTLSNSVVTANEVSGGANGAGIDVTAGALTLDSVTVSDNTAAAPGDGGGIELGTGQTLTDTIDSSTISGNTADQDGGGIDQVDSSTLVVTNSTITGNQLTSDGGRGGGFYDNHNNNTNPDSTVTFTNDTISNNDATSGGGMYNDHGSNIFFVDSTISGNVAGNGGGGGFNLPVDGSIVGISGSTITGNSTTSGGEGGGIENTACDHLNLTNDTIGGNTASADGGGFYGDTSNTEGACPAGETVNFLFDTVTGNTAGVGGSGGGGDIELQASAPLNLTNSIVAGGTPTSCLVGNVSASLTSGGYNLLGDSSCGTPAASDLVAKNPQLGALGNNGGPTLTELPGSTSPAISAIPAPVCTAAGVSTDQRGVSRPQGAGGTCTIGAVEVANFNPNGYRLVADEGGIFDFGLNFNGSLANNKLNAPIVGLANSPGPNGYLMVGGDGGVFAEGGANFYGSLGGGPIPSPIAAIAAPPSETGYWLAAQNGKIYPFGSVPSLPAVQLPPGAHLVGMASTTDGQGAWLTDQFGDVYAEGTAQYKGGLGGVHINAPIVGLAAAANGQGYVLAATDGGAFNYGTQGFFGSVPGSLQPGQSLVAPVVGIAVTHSGAGYWEVGADGGVFNYGDAPFLGSIYTAIPGQTLNGPIVGIQHLGSVLPG